QAQHDAVVAGRAGRGSDGHDLGRRRLHGVTTDHGVAGVDLDLHPGVVAVDVEGRAADRVGDTGVRGQLAEEVAVLPLGDILLVEGVGTDGHAERPPSVVGGSYSEKGPTSSIERWVRVSVRKRTVMSLAG